MDRISKKETGKKLRKEMLKRGLTVRDIQNALALESPQAVYKWLNGKALPSLENMLIIGRLFQMPLEQLLIQEDGVSAAHRPFYMDLSRHCLIVQDAVLAPSVSRLKMIERSIVETGRLYGSKSAQSKSSS